MFSLYAAFVLSLIYRQSGCAQAMNITRALSSCLILHRTTPIRRFERCITLTYMQILELPPVSCFESRAYAASLEDHQSW